ncbi:MAG: YajQ family cyclic di-GMP-binding protein [Longimicrobiales bacterium]
MAQYSFDVSTGADLQEVDNAVNQALKEISQRYDFKGTDCKLAFDRGKATVTIEADDEYRLKAAYDVLLGKFVRRGVPIKNLRPGAVQAASGARARQEIALTQGLPVETAREIVKTVKARKLKKVQTAIQGDEVRVSSASKDELQTVIQLLRGHDFGLELTFGNYR